MIGKRAPLHAVNAVLASVVLFYAVRLSRGDRGAIDWIVIGLASAAVAWNLIRLGLRLHAGGGERDLWHLLRTIGFWIVGCFNTFLIRPGDAGTWKNWLGWALLAIAAADTVALAVKERRLRGPSPPAEDEAPA